MCEVFLSCKNSPRKARWKGEHRTGEIIKILLPWRTDGTNLSQESCTSRVLQGDRGWSQGSIKGMRLRMLSHSNWKKRRKTGHLNYKVSGKKGLRKTGRRSFLCFWLMIPACLPPPRWKSWTTTFLNYRFLLKQIQDTLATWCQCQNHYVSNTF